jgi:hypothetical protein
MGDEKEHVRKLGLYDMTGEKGLVLLQKPAWYGRGIIGALD